MRSFGLALINFYQKFISPDQGFFSSGRKYCRLYPSCSEYTKEAIEYGGFLYGTYRGILRILRCHPWQNKLLDPFKP
jgi:putative membrane protein insertion efficiency factor